MNDTSPPRLLIAAPASGGGKTTLATGLMAALADRGLRVSPFKVGPDYIDPGYHALATGLPGRNLDAVLCGEEFVAPLLLHGARSCDVAVIEGVMGLFDGQLGTGGRGSSAHVAALTGTPVVLVLDCAHSSRTVAAVAAGLAGFDPRLSVAGVILNRVASKRHADEVRTELRQVGLPVLGVVPRSQGVEIPSRHLGLVPADERAQAEEQVRALGQLVAEHVDLDAILDSARSAPALDAEAWDPHRAVTPVEGNPRVAVAAGRAFTFSYAETTELLSAAGCEPVPFDPLADAELPAGTAGLLIGGGFPEVHARDLAANRALLDEIRDAAADGLPIVAECAGLLLLGESLDGHRMAGVLPSAGTMRARLRMGYRSAVAPADTLLARAGERFHGHEFHRTGVSPSGEAEVEPAWRLEAPGLEPRYDGFSLAPRGGSPTVHASYLHLHWAASPQAAERFAAAAAEFGRRAR